MQHLMARKNEIFNGYVLERLGGLCSEILNEKYVVHDNYFEFVTDLFKQYALGTSADQKIDEYLSFAERESRKMAAENNKKLSELHSQLSLLFFKGTPVIQ